MTVCKVCVCVIQCDAMFNLQTALLIIFVLIISIVLGFAF